MRIEEFNTKHRRNLCFDLFRLVVTISSCVAVFGWSLTLGMSLGRPEFGVCVGLSLSMVVLGVSMVMLTELKVSDVSSYFVALFLVLYHQVFKE